ncbi:MAG: 3-dehydroquinate synthase [Methyloceanibacter sp.]|jgi:3-dehydroquinate synthase|nr:3-dehydroquinate synthase [Methyloceanibacter sp.]
MMRDRTSSKAEKPDETIVDVSLKERSYKIVVGEGLLASAGPRIAGAVPGARCVVVTDANVAGLYLEPLADSLEREKIYIGQAIVAPGETSKSFAVLAGLSERLLEIGVERGDCVVALGGGVVGDLAGFAASVLRRGVRFVQIPTSLLAQVDSSVGGKTGIDTRQGKNLIGAFHQPSLVLADTSVLSTLPAREFRSGYAEIAKYGLLGDADFFTWLETHWQAVFAGDRDDRLKAIATSIHAKAKIVEEDEFEVTGTRALLNLGHTFGHALEAFAGYSERLLHGEAIAIGMRLAFDFSVEQGLCPKEDAARVAQHLTAVGLPTKVTQIHGAKPAPDELLALMAQDKKVKGGKLTLVLVRRIGEAFLERNVKMDALTKFLGRECAKK